MDLIDKTVNTKNDLDWKVGDTFKLIDKFLSEDNERTDAVLMIAEDGEGKYYFVSLAGNDAGMLCGWGIWKAASSIKELFSQLMPCKIVKVKATVTIENYR